MKRAPLLLLFHPNQPKRSKHIGPHFIDLMSSAPSNIQSIRDHKAAKLRVELARKWAERCKSIENRARGDLKTATQNHSDAQDDLKEALQYKKQIEQMYEVVNVDDSDDEPEEMSSRRQRQESPTAFLSPPAQRQRTERHDPPRRSTRLSGGTSN